MTDDFTAGLAAGFLAELRADPVKAVEGIELTLSQHRGGSSAMWAQLAMSMSEDPRMAEPDDPDAAAWCDYCGATGGLDLSNPDELGDRPCSCHGMVVRHCADTDGCIQRRSERYPPDLARVPGFVFTAGSEAAAQAEIASLVRAAAGQAARDYLELVRQAGEDEEIRLAQPWYWGNAAGQYDVHGTVRVPAPEPAVQNFSWSAWNWRHVMRSGHQYTGHLISGGGRLGGGFSAQVLAARQRAQEAPGEIPAEGPPPGLAAPPGGRRVPYGAVPAPPSAIGPAPGGDRALGQVKPLEAELPAHARQTAPSRRRGPQYGRRKLKYSPRKPAGKAKSHLDGSDSFHSDGADTGGPDGSAASAEVT